MPIPFSSSLLSLSRVLFLCALASSAASGVACSSGDSEDEANASGGTGGTTNVIVGMGNVGNVGSGTGGSSTVSMNGNMCVIEDDGSGCTGQAYEGENLPLDIYIMFDQSGSMNVCLNGDPNGSNCPGERRMDAVREATDLFMADEESTGIGVGISYFGKQPISQASCDVADYEAADVEIGVLPDHADAIMGSLNDVEPTGETPTGAAIRGACSYAQNWKGENPGHEVVILLLTDGIPEAPVSCCDPATSDTCMPVDPECCPTLPDAVDAATECLDGDPGIRTYVLGVGPALGNLKDIAEAGGTKDAYLVEGGEVVDEVLDALRAIRGDAIPCTMPLPTPPDGTVLNLQQVNITYASPACEPTYFYNTSGADTCEDGGWYYDDNDPPQIQLCPASCEKVSAPGGKLVYTIGCDTRIVPR
ncbi:MAG TPA: vWA domain-containing protein [Polyangiaceae bacterium]|nr:vWA domain-containing protein [Polyangiaceae bacterium]